MHSITNDMTLSTPSTNTLNQFAKLVFTSIGLTIIICCWALFDQRLIDDVAVWMKPLKFSISFYNIYHHCPGRTTAVTSHTNQTWIHLVLLPYGDLISRRNGLYHFFKLRGLSTHISIMIPRFMRSCIRSSWLVGR